MREAIHTSTPHGRLLRTILAAPAEMEGDVIRERTLSGRVAPARQGGYVGGYVYLRQVDCHE